MWLQFAKERVRKALLSAEQIGGLAATERLKATALTAAGGDSGVNKERGGASAHGSSAFGGGGGGGGGDDLVHPRYIAADSLVTGCNTVEELVEGCQIVISCLPDVPAYKTRFFVRSHAICLCVSDS